MSRSWQVVDEGAAQGWLHDPWDDPDAVPLDHIDAHWPRARVLPKIAFAVALAGVLVALGVGAVGWWYLRQVNPPGDPLPGRNFTVNDRDDLHTVSERLQDQGFIVNARVFRWYTERRGGLELVPGYYTIRPRDHLGNILRVLRTPPNKTYVKVTFPEGFTVAQMGERLAALVTGMDADRFVRSADARYVSSTLLPGEARSLEGLLFPDTYFVAGDETELQLIRRMVALMERVGRQVGIQHAQRLVGLSPYEVLIVASLIEREAKVPDDRAKIARVIYNRLFLGMPLQIDATVHYGQDPNRPFDELRRRDTPYNTYLRPGLPPTPIANPGRASIAAALAPAPNPRPSDPICAALEDGAPCLYLYFVRIDDDGRHAFAVTLEQHLANVERAREAGVL